MDIELSKRILWEDRLTLPSNPGTYLIYKSDTDKPIYIGMTAAKGGLRKRIMTFDRCAIRGSGNHAGGCTYHLKFGDDLSRLSLRYHEVRDSNYGSMLMRAYVAYIERHLIWDHAEKFGDLPLCNKC